MQLFQWNPLVNYFNQEEKQLETNFNTRNAFKAPTFEKYFRSKYRYAQLCDTIFPTHLFPYSERVDRVRIYFSH